MSDSNNDDYGLSPEKKVIQIDPPAVDYLPRKTKEYHPAIGLIGAGGITAMHLAAYKELGLNVVAIADLNEANACSMRDKFYPKAEVLTDHKALLARQDIEVVDVATHVNVRPSLVREALEAGKHVLSQKPFVTDLKEGRALIELADSKGLKLAVNQNGRWAPHFSYMRNAIADGLIGSVNSINCSCNWDHLWIKGLPNFEKMRHMVLFDFCIHWFDIVTCFMGGQKATSIYASKQGFPGQVFQPDSIASVIMRYPEAQVCMHFHSHTTLGEEDTTIVNGTKGTLRSRGPGLNKQPQVELFLETGTAVAPLKGNWFTNGFQGTMAELLCAIEENREPYNSARSNLTSLEACFAALKSADTGAPVTPGSVQVLESY